MTTTSTAMAHEKNKKTEWEQPLRPASADAVWAAGAGPAHPLLGEELGPFPQVVAPLFLPRVPSYKA